METLVAILHFTTITLFCGWYWKKQELPLRKFYWHAMAAKLSAGMLVGILYGVVYPTSDTFLFFNWANELSSLARTDFSAYLKSLWSQSDGYFQGMDRTVFFVKITSVFTWLTYDNYWITSIYFSLFSFLAAWKLTKVIWENAPDLGIPAAVAFLFFPSCVFWASGLIKESLAMTGLFYLTTLFLQIWWNHKIAVRQIVFSLVAIWVVWNLKYHYVGLFIPILLTTWLTREIVKRKQIKTFRIEIGVWFSIVVVAVVLISFTHPNFHLNRILEVLVSNNQSVVQSSNPENVIHYYQLESAWWSVAINSPWALLSGLFRPFIWEGTTLLKFIVATENLLLVLLTISLLHFFFRIKDSPHRLLVLAILVYSATLCILLAISTPNFGTLVRYRIGFLPFLVMLLINQPFIVRILSRLFNVHMPDLSR